jgi:RNA polymerase sigma-70 factor (ECF subfamily)
MTLAEAPTSPSDASRETASPAAASSLPAALRAARAGDERGFEAIMRATEARLARLAWRILGDRGEVEEALQETFLRLFRALERYDERHELTAWLYRIAVNVCRDALRRRRRRRIFAPLVEAMGLSSGEPSTAERLARRSEADRLERLIAALPPKQRLAVLLRDVEELPTEQVAEILGSSPATVRVQVSKARVKLRAALAAQGGGRR